MIRIAVGSSANPPQIGHLALIQGLVSSGFFSKVIWIPCGVRSDKVGYVEAKHRLEMTKMMLSYVRRKKGVKLELRTEDLEGDNTPTIVWLEKIKSENPGSEVWWYTGADTVAPDSRGQCEVEKYWYKGGELIGKWPLMIVPRPGYKLPAFTQSYWNKFIRVRKLETRLIDVSSSKLREKLMNGEDVGELTIPEIVNYISENKLYAN